MRAEVQAIHQKATSASVIVASLPNDATIEEELDAMLKSVLLMVEQDMPDQIIKQCMTLMGRCTELKVQLVRIEGRQRWAKLINTQQLQPVIELVDFTYKGASRLIEVARIEVELSR